MTPASATVGTGASEFLELTDGGDLEIQRGFQGGCHVWGSVHAAGLYGGDVDHPRDANNPKVHFVLTDPSGESLADTGDQRRALSVGSSGELELLGEVVRLSNRGCDTLPGHAAILTVTVTDACETTVTDARSVQLVPMM